MTTPARALYPVLFRFLHAVLGPGRLTSQTVITDLVWALLLAQSLHPADLARALPDLRTAKARQAMKRVRRLLQNKLLTSEWLTPHLVRAALRLAPERPVHLILDSTRLAQRWELFTLGVQFGGGRVLVVAWSVLPYPWPKGRYTPTVTALLARTFGVWPADCPLELLADRGFPSRALFQLLADWAQRLPLTYTIRLRAGDHVQLAEGEKVPVSDLMEGLAVGTWRVARAAYGADGPLAWLVVGRDAPVYPPHQRGPADARRRAERARERERYLRRKGQPHAVTHDRTWALLTSDPDPARAVAAYRRRFATEGTYEDFKRWDLEPVAGQARDPGQVDGQVGLAALAYLVQAAVGAAAGRTSEADARARQRQWSTADRLSVAWRGRQVLHDRAHDWQPFVRQTLTDLTQTLADPADLWRIPRSGAVTPRVRKTAVQPPTDQTEAA